MRKRTKRRVEGAFGWIVWFASILAQLVIAGLFLNGTSTSLPILSFLPAIVHTITGWVLVISAFWTAISKFL